MYTKLPTNSWVFKTCAHLIQNKIETKWIRDIRETNGEKQSYDDIESWGINKWIEGINRKSHLTSYLEHGLAK